jgi:hypothetical protein
MKPMTLFCLLMGIGGIAHSEQPEICSLLKKERKPVAYLLDDAGNIHQGPINLGAYPYKYASRDFFTLKTKYKLVIFPKKLIQESTGKGVIGRITVLEPTRSVCPNSHTYSISYQEREAPSQEYANDFIRKMPYKIEERLDMSYFSSDEDEESVKIECRFDCRFVGTIVDGSKK